MPVERPVDAAPSKHTEVARANPTKDGTQLGIDPRKPVPMRVVSVSETGTETSQEYSSPLEYAEVTGSGAPPISQEPQEPPQERRPRRGRPPKKEAKVEQPPQQERLPYPPQQSNYALEGLAKAISEISEGNSYTAELLERLVDLQIPVDAKVDDKTVGPDEAKDPIEIEGSVPNVEVTFSNEMFDYTQMYHRVIVGRETIVLIFDKSHKTITKANIRETGKPINISVNGTTYIVGHMGISFEDNNCEYTVLLRVEPGQ